MKSLEEIKEFVRNFDKGIYENGASFKVAVIMVTALYYPHSVGEITHFTGYGLHFVTKVCNRFWGAGIWGTDGKVDYEWLYDGLEPYHVMVAFWCVVLLGEGKLVRMLVEENPDKTPWLKSKRLYDEGKIPFSFHLEMCKIHDEEAVSKELEKIES